jgi:hypothetical protein
VGKTLKIGKMKYDTIVAIDPDVEKSGVAYLKPSTRQLEVSSLEFPLLLEYLQHAKGISEETNESLIVVVEASWLISHNWHKGKADNYRTAAAKGNSAGRNHEVGRKIVEMCRHYGIEVIEQRPLKKCWKGPGGKITHKELAFFTGLMGKTNQDARDAALLAWSFANLPIRLKR